jgi:hypothetical protein
MKKLLIFTIVALIHFQSFILESQEINYGSSFLKSMQGTWAFAEKDATLWMKVVIKGNRLKGYAAYPNSGKFTAEATKKIRVIKLVYKSNFNSNLKSESYAKIGESTLLANHINTGIIDGKKYIIFGNRDSAKFMKVPSDFNPWK